jgi:hypothetical protein
VLLSLTRARMSGGAVLGCALLCCGVQLSAEQKAEFKAEVIRRMYSFRNPQRMHDPPRVLPSGQRTVTGAVSALPLLAMEPLPASITGADGPAAGGKSRGGANGRRS